MKFSVLSALTLCFMIGSAPLPAEELMMLRQNDNYVLPLGQEIVDNLNSIKHSFRLKYAPKEWKLQFAGWDLDEQIAKAKAKALAAETLSLQEGRQILVDFFNSCQDYHVKIKFHSSAFSYLGFRVKSSQGRYFVTWVDHKTLVGRGLMLQVGDEILNFDGHPINTVVAEILKTYYDRGMPPTDNALAELFLTLRLGAEGLPTPQGEVSIEVLRQGLALKGGIEWLHYAEEIDDPFLVKSKGEKTKFHLAHREMKVPLAQSFEDAYRKIRKHCGYEEIIDDAFYALGSLKSYVPILGKVVWNPAHSKKFHAYIFEHPETERLIGYVRIPHYSESSGSATKEFSKLIKQFESVTDALVIDQVSNPGGDLFYMYSLASMLSHTPLIVPKHAFTINQANVQEALTNLEELTLIDTEDSAKIFLGETMSGYPVDFKFAAGVKDYFYFILDQWSKGKVLTDFCALYGVSHIKPHSQTNYTKPILFLVDSLDISAGDFMPAILQDNQRAVIFGTRTAGAGGFVETHVFPNLLGINFYTFTASYAARSSGLPIENLGVIPDIYYQVTPRDLQFGYVGYGNAVNKAVLNLIQ